MKYIRLKIYIFVGGQAGQVLSWALKIESDGFVSYSWMNLVDPDLLLNNELLGSISLISCDITSNCPVKENFCLYHIAKLNSNFDLNFNQS